MPNIDTLMPLLRPREVAQRLGLAQDTVYEWIAQGRLCAFRLGPKSLRIRETDLVKFLENSREGCFPPAR
ncbi:MAG: helix-turn-helix domain-containing protein [Armatimonadetes bacterium]|nr:helix-turn-helix domain-containing protein [Armatimonadota bacterium]